MRAGDLRHNLVFQEATQTSDGMGGFTETHNEIYSCRGAIWPLSSKEQLDSMKLELQVNHRIKIRHPRSVSITAKHRIKWHDHITDTDKYFNIVSIRNVEKRNMTLEFLALEEV
jgi:SPP1 family predicted phage head-tail adaptor